MNESTEHANDGVTCLICDHTSDPLDASQVGSVRGNTARFQTETFRIWRCPSCRALQALDPVDMADIYSDYPLNRDRTLDVFARGTYRNLLRRLTEHGVSANDSILDFGCGNAVFLRFLEEQGFTHCAGYDPFVAEYAARPNPPPDGYDCVIANDVIEHVDNPKEMMRECLELTRPGGLLYVGTADAEGVDDMTDLERHIMRLHQPFHRVILTQQSLIDVGLDLGLELVQTRRRSYMDTFMPFSNYRFLDEFNRAHGHNLDAALAPDAAGIVARRPQLLFYALFGYFLPSAMEPSVLWRRPA